ncbi:MAG: hypothetical protein IT307_17135, partial [Chloroflexi bacterium]|nr:hypothetical protein [Chloroflexota bacterium]
MSARRYTVELAGRTFQVEIEGAGQERVVRVDGTESSASFVRLADHGILLGLQNRTIPALVRRDAEETTIALLGRLVTARVLDERAERLAAFGGGRGGGRHADTVKAPMPGLVIAVSVEAGQHIARGESMVVLQAMKMENELLSPRDGV